MTFSDLPHGRRLAWLLARRPYLVADGATGTNLFDAGLATGEAPELWNALFPERVRDHHRAMAAAGADILLSNSFGGTRPRLALHGAQDRVSELNRQAAELARDAADEAGREVLVAGSIGPTGAILAPVGELPGDRAVAMFREQAGALAEGGADILWIETMSSEEEAAAAIEAAGATGLPIVCTMTFDTNGCTMMGITPRRAARFYDRARPRLAACGANCGNGFGELVAAVAGIGAASPPDRVLVAKANCGLPTFVDGRIGYSGTPELMRVYGRLARDAGARIIGGCCGATADHIAVLARALDDHPPGERPDLETIERALGLERAAPAGERRARRSRRRGPGKNSDCAPHKGSVG